MFYEKPMKIHVSEHTKALLPPDNYRIVERGKIEVKGKGVMKTYFVLNKIDDDGVSVVCPFMKIIEEHKRAHGEFLEDVSPPDEKHAGFVALETPKLVVNKSQLPSKFKRKNKIKSFKKYIKKTKKTLN